MPYIEQCDRPDLDEVVRRIPPNLTMGELNYLITKILLDTEPHSYTDYNALIGVLECIKLELYRRAIVPYEDEKKSESGDVY